MPTNTAITADFVIVGAGLTGAVIANTLADAKQNVVVLERRHVLGGNVADAIHSPSGIRYNLYGPHYFRTNSKTIWSYVNRFSEFYAYSAIVKAKIGKTYYPWPIGKNHAFAFSPPSVRGKAPANFEEAVLQKMAYVDYRKYVYGYTFKQWGVEPRLLAAELARRIEVRPFEDERFTLHVYQGMPKNGYTGFVSNLLKGIPCFLNYDYLKQKAAVYARRKLIFTGPLDEFFGFKQGKLKYRGQKRTTRYFAKQERLLPCGQVNFPEAGHPPAQRILEWRHMMEPSEQTRIRGTLLTQETACNAEIPDRYEYPFPDEINRNLRDRYMQHARELSDIIFCGRLGTYQYYDMETAIGQALSVAQNLINKSHADFYQRQTILQELYS